MSLNISQLIDRIEGVSKEIKNEFSTLPQEQLNWKPSAEAWSIGECLDHIMITNSLYFKQFDRLLSGKAKSFWEKIPLLANLFGGMLLKALGPVPTSSNKLKSPKVFQPSQSKIQSDIVQQFLEHNEKLKEYFNRLQLKDPEHIITSPAAAFVTLRLGIAMQIITNHEERHLHQAKNIKLAISTSK